MLPKNNLSAELEWLLSTQPFVPSAAPLVTYEPDPPLSSVTRSQPSIFTADPPPPNDELDRSYLRETTHSIPQLSRTRTLDIHGLPSQQSGATDMARLRATPKNNKPRLILADLPPKNVHSTPGSRAMAENSAARIPGSSVQRQRTILHDVEAIDLTGNEGRYSPSKSRARKRKSDEYAEDLRQTKSPRPARTIPASSPSTDYEGFTNIDDMMTLVPESPPPPYSTTVPNGRIPEAEEDVDMDAFTQSAPGSRKRKSLSRLPSDSSAPARKLGKSTRSPSPSKGTQAMRNKTPKRRVQNAVLDSEDDDLESFDGFDLDVMPRARLERQSPTYVDPLGRSSQIELPIRSPSKPREETVHSQLVRDPLVTPETTQPSRRMRPSPTKVQPTPISTLQLANIPSASALSRDEKLRIRQAVEMFLDSEGGQLKRHIESAVSIWAKAKDAYLKHAEAGTSMPAHQESIKRAHIQKRALEQLLLLKDKHEDLANKRQDLRRKIAEDLDDCEFNDDDSQALEAYGKSLADLQVQMYSFLGDAGMERYADSSTIAVDQNSGGVIESDQVTPVSNNSKTAKLPVVEHIPQTQYLKQTQISKHKVWTSSQQIRFAETRVVESTPPLLDWNQEAKSRPDSMSDERVNMEQEPRPIYESRHGSAVSRQQSNIRENPVESIAIYDDDDEDLGFTFDADDVCPISGRASAAPGFTNAVEDEFYDEDDDALFQEFSNIENKTPDSYDWKGDKVDSHNVRLAREDSKEAHTKVQQRKAPAAPSPKKPQLYAPNMNHAWSRDVRDALLYSFRLRGFRPGQLEAVNTTLAGEHCFVLMPTGGGKSLCYQLPSIIKSGRTQGVTIVVSPLLSLMEDQVSACKNRFGMQAFVLNGESSTEEKDKIKDVFWREPDPQAYIQVLYVTPEMLSKNQRMIEALGSLHRRNRLARIVIDEAHCVSQWGHDFRPDYKALGDVIRQFSSVPIIALTATATQLVRTDVMANLGINGCRVFSQSFNRPNLAYAVLSKPRNFVQHIADLIEGNFPGKCGIVYCLGRKTCESVAKKLTGLGISAYHYHAGMEPAERTNVQRKWQANKYHVIVATIAFGMGIDKADVRFVIHQSLPKSLEGYYQETGRAGRDGKKSNCYLYYNYGDCKILKKMIDEGEGNVEQKARQHDMLRKVIQFCENKSDCRRVQVLNYFSESFKKEDCKKTCDNCTSDATFETRDLTVYAQKAIELINRVHESKVTVLQCVDAFRGAKNARFKKNDIGDLFGFGADLERGDVERVFNHLLDSRALRESSVFNKSGFTTNYVHIGPKAREYASGKTLFNMQVRVIAAPKEVVVRKEPKKKASKNRPEYPSTNVSSPARPLAKKNLKQYTYEKQDKENQYDTAPHPSRGQSRVRYGTNTVLPDDNDDSEDGEFEDVREAKPHPRHKIQKPRSAPITVDERLASLNEIQQDILGHFMKDAKSLIQKIKLDKGLKFAPFSDTILREMCLDLPRNNQEMLAIPGVNPEMARLYGKKFLNLINNSRSFFAAAGCLPVPRHLARRAPFGDDDEDDDDDDDEEEERPADPNHRIIDLCGDSDDEQHQVQVENESVISIDGYEDDDDDDGMVCTSHHFNQPVNPAVEAFNRQISQIRATRPTPLQQTSNHAARSTAPRATSRQGFQRKGSHRKQSSDNFGKSHSGVAKRAASRGSTVKRSRGTGGARNGTWNGPGNRRAGAGSGAGASGGGNIIAAMPT